LDALSEIDRTLFKQVPHDPDHQVVVTAETIFYAQGGGQPSDTGTMHSVLEGQDQNSLTDAVASPFSVHAIRHSASSPGQILHLGRFEPGNSRTFTAGQSVRQAIDGEKRQLHSRIHDAGHILSLAVRHLSHGSGEEPKLAEVTELKAQHYPDAAFVEFRGLIDGKHKDAIQAQCDAFVSQALPIKVYWLNEAELREKCAIVPDNLATASDGGDDEPGLFRVVDIEGAGAYPCGGTHVTDTSVVGKVEVRRITRSKGITKISYQVR
jgi:Ser-tRNA(Ala) deacylase AlaX